MKIKWFEIVIVLIVIGTTTMFSVQKSHKLKSTQLVLSKKQDIVNDFYQESPIGSPMSKKAFNTAILAYSPELAAMKKLAQQSSQDEPLSEENEVSTRIGVLQGQINDIKDEIKAIKDSSFPWWLTMLLGAGSWFLGHLFAPLATAFGEKMRDGLIKSENE